MVINKGPEDGFAIENGDIPSLCYWSVHSWKLEALIPFACSDEFRPQLGMDGALGRLNHLKSIEQSCKTWAIMTFDIIWWHLVTLEKVIHYGIFAICLFFFLQVFKFRVFVAKYASFFGESNKWIMSIWSFFCKSGNISGVVSCAADTFSAFMFSDQLQLQQLGIYLLQNLLDAWQKGGDMVTKNVNN